MPTPCTRPRLLAALLAAVLISAACSGGGDSKTPSTSPAQAITISTAAATLDIAQGGSASISVTIARTGGFAGDVTVTVEGLPAGVTASALTITSASTTGNITLTALATAVVAGSTLAVRGSGSGISSATSSVALNVRAAAATGAVSVIFNPSSLTIIQGATVNLTATITRTGGFTGPVTFNVTGLPTGLTATVTQTASTNQTVVTSNSANFAFTASPTMAIGTSNVGITASGTGVATSTVTLVTQVNAAVAGTNAVWTFCQAFGIPIAVYVQDGTSAFTKIAAGANNTYTFSIAQSKGGVAWDMQPNASSNMLFVFFGTQAEIVAQGAANCANQGPTPKSVNGALLGITGTDLGTVSLGSSTASVNSAGGVSFTLNNVPNGNLDLIGTRTILTVNGSNITTSLAAVVVRRALNIGNGVSISPSIDVSPASAEAVVPVNKTLTLTGLNGDQAFVSVAYFTPTTNAAFFSEYTGTSPATHAIPTMPASKQQSGDYHYVSASAQASFTASSPVIRLSGMYFFAGADKTLALGPTPSATTVSNLNFAAPVRLNAAFTMQLEYNKYFFASFSQPGTPGRFVQVSATTGYIGSATTINLGIPDLVQAGYPATRGLQPLTQTNVSIGAAGWPTSGGVVNAPPVDGGTYMLYLRALTYTP